MSSVMRQDTTRMGRLKRHLTASKLEMPHRSIMNGWKCLGGASHFQCETVNFTVQADHNRFAWACLHSGLAGTAYMMN
jgi:hypothetical protein